MRTVFNKYLIWLTVFTMIIQVGSIAYVQADGAETAPLVMEDGFEAGWGNYTPIGSESKSLETGGDVINGDQSAKIETANGDFQAYLQQTNALAAGQDYTLQLRYKTLEATDDAQLFIMMKGSGPNKAIAFNLKSNQLTHEEGVAPGSGSATLSTNGYVDIQFSFHSDSINDYRIEFNTYSTGALSLLLDDIRLYQGTTNVPSNVTPRLPGDPLYPVLTGDFEAPTDWGVWVPTVNAALDVSDDRINGGQSAKFHTEDGGFVSYLTTAIGSLKGNTRYSVQFRYTVLAPPADGRIYVILKNTNADLNKHISIDLTTHTQSDGAGTSVIHAQADYVDVTAQFVTDPSSDYFLEFDTNSTGEVNLLVDDIQVYDTHKPLPDNTVISKPGIEIPTPALVWSSYFEESWGEIVQVGGSVKTLDTSDTRINGLSSARVQSDPTGFQSHLVLNNGLFKANERYTIQYRFKKMTDEAGDAQHFVLLKNGDDAQNKALGINLQDYSVTLAQGVITGQAVSSGAGYYDIQLEINTGSVSDYYLEFDTLATGKVEFMIDDLQIYEGAGDVPANIAIELLTTPPPPVPTLVWSNSFEQSWGQVEQAGSSVKSFDSSSARINGATSALVKSDSTGFQSHLLLNNGVFQANETYTIQYRFKKIADVAGDAQFYVLLKNGDEAQNKALGISLQDYSISLAEGGVTGQAVNSGAGYYDMRIVVNTGNVSNYYLEFDTLATGRVEFMLDDLQIYQGAGTAPTNIEIALLELPDVPPYVGPPYIEPKANPAKLLLTDGFEGDWGNFEPLNMYVRMDSSEDRINGTSSVRMSSQGGFTSYLKLKDGQLKPNATYTIQYRFKPLQDDAKDASIYVVIKNGSTEKNKAAAFHFSTGEVTYAQGATGKR